MDTLTTSGHSSAIRYTIQEQRWFNTEDKIENKKKMHDFQGSIYFLTVI